MTLLCYIVGHDENTPAAAVTFADECGLDCLVGHDSFLDISALPPAAQQAMRGQAPTSSLLLSVRGKGTPWTVILDTFDPADSKPSSASATRSSSGQPGSIAAAGSTSSAGAEAAEVDEKSEDPAMDIHRRRPAASAAAQGAKGTTDASSAGPDHVHNPEQPRPVHARMLLSDFRADADEIIEQFTAILRQRGRP